MKGLLIIGAGGHGKVVADAALSIGWSNVAFLDDQAATLKLPLGLPVLGAVSELEQHVAAFSSAVVAVGNSVHRLQLLARCRQSGIKIVSIVHPTAFVSKFASIGPGCVVFAQSAINADARLGEACIVNTGATVDHDCILGDGVHICPGAHLAGLVRVGDRTWVGIGATVRQDSWIGSDVTIGAGAVVVANVADGVTVMGIPAKPQTRIR